MKPNLLIVDDEYRIRQAMAMQLERRGYAVSSAASGKEALAQLEMRRFDYALVDLKMSEMDGMELLRRMQARWPETAVIIMTGYSDVSSAITAIKAGAFHYLAKPVQLDDLLDTLTKAEPHRRKDPFHAFVGESAAIRNALVLARHAATSDKPVVITGELGTGKETLAGAIHASSPRASAPLVAVRCAASGHLEDDLFGQGIGRPGRLIEANGGTILLDCIADAPEAAQLRLLRFLQDDEIQWDAAARPLKSNVRVIATSPIDLAAAVRSMGFRDDLRLRLSGIHIHLPPLRDRPQDIPGLVRGLIDKYSPRGGRVKIDKDALDTLQRQPLLGNMLELESTVEQAVSLAHETITVDVLRMTGIEDAPEPTDHSRHPLKEDLEREEKNLIEESLARNGHNLRLVSIDLEISRTSLWRKMKRYGLAD